MMIKPISMCGEKNHSRISVEKKPFDNYGLSLLSEFTVATPKTEEDNSA